jgi:solute carrier family 25 (mitochondrial phosphate transporter), member 3
VDPTKYVGLLSGIRTVIAEETAVGLVKGWAPTFIGYSLQGAGKFGLYEVFKDLYSTALGEEGSYKHRAIVYAAASGSAEFVADILLCPMEMVKVRLTMGDDYGIVRADPNKCFGTW